MATHTSFLRQEGIDNATIKIHPSTRQIYSAAPMEPFTAQKGSAASTFYVDGNRVSSGNGLTWDTAFKTLTEGLTAARAYHSTSGNRAWAHRSTVYACGDSLTEDLVVLAGRTDVIGVGSDNNNNRPVLIGNHVPVTTNCLACSFYNWVFAEVDAGIMWTLTAVSSGLKFENCHFQGRGAIATHGILWTLSYNLEVSHCYFDTGITSFTTGAIVIGAGVSDDIWIHDNVIVGAKGIVINASYAQVSGQCIIDNNVFRTATQGVTDSSNLALVTRNMFISAADNDTITNIVTSNIKLACGNIVTGDSSTQTHPFAADA